MLNFLKDDDKFIFNAIVDAPTGKKEGPAKALTAQYKRVEGNLEILLNGISKDQDTISAKRELTYKEFKEAYADSRVYFTGYVDLKEESVDKAE